jgi:hypothetical protein
LDDFPRAEVISVNEGHVDLHCWIVALVRAMANLATRLDKVDDAARYSMLAKTLFRDLESTFVFQLISNEFRLALG